MIKKIKQITNKDRIYIRINNHKYSNSLKEMIKDYL